MESENNSWEGGSASASSHSFGDYTHMGNLLTLKDEYLNEISTLNAKIKQMSQKIKKLKVKHERKKENPFANLFLFLCFISL